MNKEFAELLGRAKDIFFFAPLLEEKQSPRHFVCPYNNGIMVKMSIGGSQQFLGWGFRDVEIASRFADMASLRFAKYRRKTVFNFSEKQAQLDTANTEEEGGMLANHLLTLHEMRLRESNKLEIIGASIASPKPRRRTVESRLAALQNAVADLLSATANLSILEQRIDVIQKCFAAVESRIAALESMKGLITIEGKTYINTGPPDISPQQPIFYPAINPEPITTPITPPTIWTAKQTDQQN